MNIIEAKNISKSYGGNSALSDVSINVGKSIIFALAGPNGAGKTTFVKTLLNLSKQSKGTFLINGKKNNDKSARQEVGFLPEKFSFFSYYSILGTLKFYGKMYGLKGNDLNQQIEKALTRLDIIDIKNKKMGKLSKGQIQRTGISCMLLKKFDLLVFDEPFSGLDPIGIRDVKDLFKELKSNGTTVFINSHILSEVEQIADELAIMHKGKCLAQGDLKALIQDESLENYFYNLIKMAS